MKIVVKGGCGGARNDGAIGAPGHTISTTGVDTLQPPRAYTP